MKKVLAVILAVMMLLGMTACGESENQLQTFYNKVSESQELLDAVADDIYSNWYGAIYDDEFGEDINRAIAAAQLEHEEDLEKIEELDGEISELFKIVKGGEQGSLAKAVMTAYSDYYEFVVNVSGSFKSFSADKETLKKELASALKELSFEF